MIRLAVRVPRARAEIVLAELLAVAPSGVEEVDRGETVEYAVYGPPGELPALPELAAEVAGEPVDVRTAEVADDWHERWREFHRPLVLPGRLAIRPPWVPAVGEPLELVVDPGRAFGTGAHATTRLCLEMLCDLAGDGGGATGGRGALLDLGCGSGVLAIAAARLGWSPVIAADNDRSALEAAAANAAANGVRLDLRRIDLRRDAVPAAPVALANLLRPLLLAWARSPAPLPSRIVAGGLLLGEADEVAAAFAARGLVERDRRARGEWAALLLGAASPAGRRPALPSGDVP